MAATGLFATGGVAAAFGLMSGPGFIDAAEPRDTTGGMIHRYMAYQAFDRVKGKKGNASFCLSL